MNYSIKLKIIANYEIDNNKYQIREDGWIRNYSHGIPTWYPLKAWVTHRITPFYKRAVQELIALGFYVNIDTGETSMIFPDQRENIQLQFII